MNSTADTGGAAVGLVRTLGLLGVAASLGCGQLLFKWASEKLVAGQGLAQLARSFVSVPMAAALTLYAVATVAWVYLLRGLPLSRAYPFVALAFALVPLFSHFVFGDDLGTRYVLGLAFVLTGLYLTATIA